MRFRHIITLLVFLLSITIALSQSNTFRINYDIANFDLVGGSTMAPDSNYVIAGTNATFIPLYGKNLLPCDLDI